MFKAIYLEEHSGGLLLSYRDLDDAALPPGNVTVRVEYTTINYKDGMILKGLGRMVRSYPHVPGIDFAGIVSDSSNLRYKPGDRVVLTGWRVGEAHWGGYATKARVNADWLVPLPQAISTRRAMALGTAGVTAMLSVMALEEHGLKPGDGEVLVTGATGGVGSVAVALLATLGHKVAASTGKSSEHDYLRALGAANILDRNEFSQPGNKPLEAERWAGCIDNVGGVTLARALSQLSWHASACAVGLTGGNTVTTSLLPFLLRGVNLLGIDSNNCPYDRRVVVWDRLARHLPMDKLDAMTVPAKFADLPGLADQILAGKLRGRVVVDVNA